MRRKMRGTTSAARLGMRATLARRNAITDVEAAAGIVRLKTF